MMHQYVARTLSNAIAATTAETLIQIVTPSTRRAELIRWGVSFDGVTATDAAVDVELLRQTTAGTASAQTPLLLNPADPAALCSAQITFTAEPTAGDILEAHQVTPIGGLLVVEYARDERPVMAVSTRLALRATAPTSGVNVTAFMVWQE